MLIITGTGRSGTETLARIMDGHHEFRVNYILEKYFLRADPHSEPFGDIETRLKAILDLHQGIDSLTFIDSSNLYIHFIDAIHILNPSARFILSVRDGRDFARSAFNRKWHERNMVGMVPPYGDPYFEKWDEMTPLERNAWIWAYRNNKALKSFECLPVDRKLIIRIEDLNQTGVLDEIEHFTGITIRRSLASRKFNADGSIDVPPKEEWSRSMNEEFDTIAGELMRHFGYYS